MIGAFLEAARVSAREGIATRQAELYPYYWGRRRSGWRRRTGSQAADRRKAQACASIETEGRISMISVSPAIVRDPERCGGKPTVAGTRTGVHHVISYLNLYGGDL